MGISYFFHFFINFPCYSMGILHFFNFPCYSMGTWGSKAVAGKDGRTEVRMEVRMDGWTDGRLEIHRCPKKECDILHTYTTLAHYHFCPYFEPNRTIVSKNDTLSESEQRLIKSWIRVYICCNHLQIPLSSAAPSAASSAIIWASGYTSILCRL